MTANSKILYAAALLAATLGIGMSPAFALCNPGSPHCVKVAPGSELAKLKAKLKNPGTLGSGDVECKNARLCGIDTGDGTSPGFPIPAARRGAGGFGTAGHTPVRMVGFAHARR